MKKIFISLMICGMAFAGEVQLSLATDKDAFFIGDRIPLRYSLQVPRNTELHAVDAREWIRTAEVLQQKVSARHKFGKRILIWELEITAFDTGYIHIPIMPMRLDRPDDLRDTVYTPETNIYIRSILDTDAVPIAMNPPLPLTLMRWWQYLISGLLLVSAVYLLWYGIKYQKKRNEDPGIPLSPYEKARNELDLLASRKYPATGTWKAFYLELTQIVRTFYENIFFIHLRELTTSELIPVIKSYITEDEYKELVAFFQFADLVKFAKRAASEEQCGQHLALVKNIIMKREKEYHEAESMD